MFLISGDLIDRLETHIVVRKQYNMNDMGPLRHGDGTGSGSISVQESRNVGRF